MEMKKLKVSTTKNLAVYIEEQIEEDNVFFHEYETAAKKLNDIWEAQKDLQHDTKLGQTHEYPNNVIAFCGERGSGKSSAMLSFMKALENAEKGQNKFNFREEIKNNHWNNQIMIDPSMFDGVHNIVDLVLTHIYYDFDNAYEQDNQKIDQYEKMEMLSLLGKTYKSLSIIKNQEKMLDEEYDVAGNISRLKNLGESTQLRRHLKKLIDRYLEITPKLKNGREQKNEKLLIAIDDLDLCSEYAYDMAEQIRKYLILPNVIILMAIKIEQLEMGVEEKNRGDFRNIIAGRREDEMINQEMRDMADRYVTKLIPKTRRIYLPKLESKNIVLEIEPKVESEESVIDKKQKTIENIIIQLICEKTGMLLAPVEDNKNYFMPENLRELVNLILFLVGMKKQDDSKRNQNSSDTIKENLNDFHSYFLEEVIKKKISGKRFTDLLEVVASEDSIINYNAGIYLDQLLEEKKKEANVYDTLIYELPNTSLAAVVDKLEVASRYLTRKEDYQLFYYIKLYYTILLNESLQEKGKINPSLINGFIWGNKLNGILPAVIMKNQVVLNRERFFINIMDAWDVIADTFNNDEKLPFNIEKRNSSEIKEGETQIYVRDIKGPDKLPEAMCIVVQLSRQKSKIFIMN